MDVKGSGIEDGWQFAEPEQVGLDGQRLATLGPWLDEVPGSNIHSVLVARHGALAFELHRRGADERWGTPLSEIERGPGVKHDLRSVTKIVTGLLVGIANEANLLPDLDAPIFDFLPDHHDLLTPGKNRIRIRDLLTMSSGLDWNENIPPDNPDNGEIRMWRSDDHIRTALEPSLTSEPGSVWNYSGGCTEILGAILERVSGMSLEKFAQETLFEPLSISDVDWARHRDNSVSASGGLRMCSRDLAKIGQCVCDGGRWRDRQVLPAAWREQSTRPWIGCDDRLFFYGYHWWLGRSLFRRNEIHWAAGIGLGGQRLFVISELEMAVVVTAGHYADGMQSWLPLTILNRYILPAVR